MCGINGFNWQNQEKIQDMNRALAHRGPNQNAYFCDQNISFGQVRLSILDLSVKGQQPLGLKNLNNTTNLIYKNSELDTADYIMVFNGEIYNYLELQEEIIKSYPNEKFSSTSDSEVILKAYHYWGENCVTKFNGMWAFCIYDKIQNTLYCSRDRLGQKPFYYYFKDGKFIFSSELKGLLKHQDLRINKVSNINQDGLELFFSLSYIPAPYSIFNDVFKLEARNCMIFDLNQNKIAKKWEYYKIPKFNPINDKETIIKNARALLNDSISLRMRADVPVGAFLSGGLDSSTIVEYMRNFTDLEKLHTFSIGFEGKYDESTFVNIVKNHVKTKHHHFYYTEKDFQDYIESYVYHYDEPFGDYSGFPISFLSKMTKEYVTVVLGGDGGDEVFGGYKMYLGGARWDIVLNLVSLIPKSIRKWFGKKYYSESNSIINKLYKIFAFSVDSKANYFIKYYHNNYFRPKVYCDWIKPRFDECLNLTNEKMAESLRLFDLLYNTIPDLYCVKVDRSTMAFGLEARSPFLDYRFAELSQQIPTKWKQNSHKTKIIMREIIKGIVPDSITNRGKKGFHPPIDIWILNPKFQDYFIKGLDILESLNSELHKLFSSIFGRTKKNTPEIINLKIYLFIFTNWYLKWIEF